MFLYSFVSIFIPLVFIIVFGVIAVNIIRGIGEWSSNNKQPILDVNAKIVSKRTNVSRSNHHHNNHMHTSTNTTYYVTFEVQSGDRMEFHISAAEFGMIAEGDIGKLTFQGTRYHSFERVIN